jgi:putative ABC transport system permease protein
VNPLGRQIVLSGRSEPLTVVGVTGDVRQTSLGSSSRPEIYLNGLQRGPDWSTVALVVRSASDPRSLVPDVRAAIRTVNPDVAIARIGRMEDVIAGSVAQPRVYTILIGAFAVLAVALAALGLYGVVSYSVAQQTRELGIRLALGSTPGGIVRSVLREGISLTGIGIAFGTIGTALTAQALSTLLPGSGSKDALVFVAVAGVMTVIGAAASFIPARRAARVDPLAALRVD